MSWFGELYPYLAGAFIGIGISWLYRIAMEIADDNDRRYDPDHPALSCLRDGRGEDDEWREGAG